MKRMRVNCLEILSEQQTWCHAPKLGTIDSSGIYEIAWESTYGEFVAIEPQLSTTVTTVDLSDLSEIGPDIDRTKQPDVSVTQQPTPDTARHRMDFDASAWLHYGTSEVTSRDNVTLMVFDDSMFGFDSSHLNRELSAV
ncbi:hypothetical protein CEK25_013504 [Fusarium fujikuroi]|nr:hypothetical protein CEK25_013504 [Fusarium fujikuroi]